jgi:FdrA protein
MGPDCGTAIIGGVPLAFANEVPRGGVGIVSASGTGLQEVSCLIARGGGGISHGIGVGGRDLGEAVGGIMTLSAIEALDRDDATDRIVIISKPPSPLIAKKVLQQVGRSPKPFTICFLGLGNMSLPPNAHPAQTLLSAAEDALGKSFPFEKETERRAQTAAAELSPEQELICGFYSGGTLCAEAQIVLRAAGESVCSNVPIPGAEKFEGKGKNIHTVIDMGADEYTVGRPHPMLDPIVRNEAIARALGDPKLAVLLLDVVIGFGAHEDPAGAIVEVLDKLPDRHVPVVTSVCGTEDDPQSYSNQVKKLEAAGVIVASSNAQATKLALQIARRA